VAVGEGEGAALIVAVGGQVEPDAVPSAAGRRQAEQRVQNAALVNIDENKNGGRVFDLRKSLVTGNPP
jgi:hypothetical protein